MLSIGAIVRFEFWVSFSLILTLNLVLISLILSCSIKTNTLGQFGDYSAWLCVSICLSQRDLVVLCSSIKLFSAHTLISDQFIFSSLDCNPIQRSWRTQSLTLAVLTGHGWMALNQFHLICSHCSLSNLAPPQDSSTPHDSFKRLN